MTDEPRFVYATRIGGHAYRYLTARPRTGRVVSSFSGGINLLFEKGEAFVPVQTASVALHPWAIEIPGEPLRFAEGTPVRVRSGEFLAGDTYIVFSTAQVEELSLPRFSAHEAVIARHNLPILARFGEEARKAHPPDPFQTEIDAILVRWHESGDPRMLFDLIGLGAGATPSGDDVLVGLLAGLSLLKGEDSKCEEVLTHLHVVISDTARSHTPLPSAQMLLAACEGAFPEPLLTLLEHLASSNTLHSVIIERSARVAELGHHSGLAIILGLARARVLI